MVTIFGANRRKLVYSSSFCVLEFHNGWEDRNVDVRVNTADDPPTSDKIVVNFGWETSDFCRRFCAGQATRWALLRISS